MRETIVQGKCLVGTEGYKWMNLYDQMPPEIRLRLQSSNHNICAACLQDEFQHSCSMAYGRIDYNHLPMWHRSIDRIEAKINDTLN